MRYLLGGLFVVTLSSTFLPPLELDGKQILLTLGLYSGLLIMGIGFGLIFGDPK